MMLFHAVFFSVAIAAADPTGPVVFWASDPVRPNEAVTVVGHGLADQTKVEVVRLADAPPTLPTAEPLNWPEGGQSVELLQPGPQSLKFVVPPAVEPGLFAYRITTAKGSTVGLLNRPQAYWAQGDLGLDATAGTTMVVFGRNMGGPAVGPEEQVRAHLAGPVTHPNLPGKAGAYFVDVRLPEELPAGAYRISIHAGRGGNAGWSEPLAFKVTARKKWPTTTFNVRQYGAEGDGRHNDTSAIQAALDKAAANGGGVILFPRGRYAVNEMLRVPRFTQLQGERAELACLCWPDLPEPPEALIRGTNSFIIQNLTLYAHNHRHVIVGDLGDQPDSGNVMLANLRVRADAYRGHLKPEEVDKRLRDSLRLSTGGGDTVRLGGNTVVVRNCDFYGSGRSLYLSRVRGGAVLSNRFCNGRWGWYSISGSDGLIVKQNEFIGADLMSTGGGLNCLDGSAYSQNVYMVANRFGLLHGWDREAMTSDAGGEAYFGKMAATEGNKMTLAGKPDWKRRNWVGGGVFLLAGKGAGQYRRVAAYSDQTVELDRPWLVEPDAATDVGITMFHGRYIILGNQFADTGAVQLYGTSIECLVANNVGERMQGFRALGLWYHGYQPSWYCQFLENRIAEGNYYHWNSPTEAILEVMGARRAPFEAPLNRGAVIRGNHLQNNAHIRVVGSCKDVIVENNTVENAQQGVFVSKSSDGVLVRENRFQHVERLVVDEEALRRAAQERLKRYVGRKEPVAVWTFEEFRDKKTPDSSGNGFAASALGNVEPVKAGRRGVAARFDGTGCLRVDEPEVFNALDLTVSLWVKPATVRGRRGLVAKRFTGAAAPFVLSQVGAKIAFEATEENGPWSFNFQSPDVLKENQWTHVAAVIRSGVGVSLYVDGKPVAEKKNSAVRASNDQPLILARDAWGGDPPKGNTPGFFVGDLDEVKIWARALGPEEIKAEADGTEAKENGTADERG